MTYVTDFGTAPWYNRDFVRVPYAYVALSQRWTSGERQHPPEMPVRDAVKTVLTYGRIAFVDRRSK